MLKVIVPMCGDSLYSVSESYSFPKILTEIHGKALLEHALACMQEIAEPFRLIFVVPEKEAKALGFHTALPVLFGSNVKIVVAPNKTGGALCTSLLALDQLSADDELVILSAEQYIERGVGAILNRFRTLSADAGVVVFDSIHPKWSYVKVDSEGVVFEAAEKRVISRSAMVGLTYFRRADFFISSSKNAVRKGAVVDGLYYVSSCLNEMCLQDLKVQSIPLGAYKYFNFYDAHSINSFEKYMASKEPHLLSLTREYVSKFNNGDLEGVSILLADDVQLIDPNVSLSGKHAVKDFLNDLFDSFDSLSFVAKQVLLDGSQTVIEFDLKLNEREYLGVDIIEWNGGRISKLTAYLYG